MTKKPSTYVVQEGDSLPSIANALNISIIRLKQLNIDKILDDDFMSVGSTLNLDADAITPIKIEAGKRISLIKEPSEPANGNNLCRMNEPEFIDILYVPSHPTTKKRAYFALTKEAKKAIVDEMAQLEKAMGVTDIEKRFSNLNSLGILSKFENKQHLSFLKGADKENLKYAYKVLTLITHEGSEEYKKDANVQEIKAVAKKIRVDYDSLKRSNEKHCTPMNLDYNPLGDWGVNAPLDDQLFLDIENEEQLEAIRLKVLWKTKADVIDALKEFISVLEKRAIKKSTNYIADDGTHFVYDNEREYYSSEEQEKVNSAIEMVVNSRAWSDMTLANQETKDIKDDIKHFWEVDLKDTFSAMFCGGEPFDDTKKEHADYTCHVKFAYAILNLNLKGYVVKEQCLTFNELVGTEAKHSGPHSLSTSSKYKDWRSDKKLTIDIADKEVVVKKLLKEVFTLETDIVIDIEYIDKHLLSTHFPTSSWAYYPTLALIRFIDMTLNKWLSDIKETIKAVYPGSFSGLILVKTIAEARIEQLKSIAKERSGNVENIKYLHIPLPAFILLWDESKFKPAEKFRNGFRNVAGAADLDLVECSLLSSKDGKVGWIRAPAWYLPYPHKKDEKKCDKKYVKDITNKVSIAKGANTENTSTENAIISPIVNVDSMGQSFADVMKSIKGKSTTLTLSKTIIEHPGHAYWDASYHYDGKTKQGEKAFSVDAQAQFLRFSTVTTNTKTVSLDSLVNNVQIPTLGYSAENRVNFTLLSGQVNFSDIRLPIVGSHKMEIDYFVKNKAEMQFYDLGGFYGKFSSSLYGFAGASCVLSANLQFGSFDRDGKLGMKGTSIMPADYNKKALPVSEERATEKPKEIPQGTGATGGAAIDVFAGVEVGMVHGAKCFWIPPSPFADTKPNDALGALLLGDVVGKAAVDIGLGIGIDMQLTIARNRLVFIAKGRLVWGPGASGDLCILINPLVVDRFLSHWLGILQMSGFDYIAVFGSRDEQGKNSDFEFLNQCLTIALVLGLSLLDVIMLPNKMLDYFHKGALQEKYSAEIGAYLVDNNDKPYIRAKNKLWVNNLPPEVLASLLNCLVNTVEEPWFFESDTEESNRITGETKKAQAIALIFKWIAPETNETDEQKIMTYCRQFEKTLILMGGNGERANTYLVKWKRFASAWQRIEDFIFSLPKEVNVDIIRAVKKAINKAVAVLGRDMQGHHNLHGMITRYQTYKKEALQTMDEKELAKFTQAKERQIVLCKATKATPFEIWRLNEHQ